METLAARGNRRAALAQRLVRNLETCISATQMGVTLCGVGTGIVMKPTFEALLHPLFRLLGTPAKDKKHLLYAGGHNIIGQLDVMKDILDWLDHYLGPVKLR